MLLMLLMVLQLPCPWCYIGGKQHRTVARPAIPPGVAGSGEGPWSSCKVQEEGSDSKKAEEDTKTYRTSAGRSSAVQDLVNFFPRPGELLVRNSEANGNMEEVLLYINTLVNPYT
jgi:hypothetical protein